MYRTESDPYQHLVLLRDRINRLFDAASTRGADADSGADGAAWSPLVDLYETDQKVVLVAEVPGLSMEDLDVQVTESTLTLRGERPEVSSDEGPITPNRLERAHGTFSRTFQLSGGIDRDGVTAEYRLGLLTVVLPKKKAQSRSIRVNKT